MSCIGIAWSKLDAICIPLMQVGKHTGYWMEEEEAALVFEMYRLFTHPNAQIVGQNFLYDAQYIYRWWHFVPRVVRDTMIGQHALFCNMPKALDFQSSMYCEHHVYWKDEGKEYDPRKHPEERYWAYNCTDAVRTYEIDDVQMSLRETMGMAAPFDFQQSLFHPVLRTMLRGVRIDQKVRKDFGTELMSEIETRDLWFKTVLGHKLNPRSPLQMQKLIYDDLKQPVIRKRSMKEGRVVMVPTLDDAALTTIHNREPLLRPLVKNIAEIRSLGVFLSTFVRAPLDADERMRCSFNVAGTVTYRFSSSENAFGSGTNLQNVPKGEESEDELALDLPNVRKFFIPDPGHTFFDMDLSKADLRIVVWEADDQEMKSILKSGGDPYVIVAREYYRDPTIQKGSGIKGTKYDTFKRFCHGTHYLGKPPGLAKRLGLTTHEADKAQKWYFSRFPAIKKSLDDLQDQVAKRRMVQNIWGHRIYIFDRIDDTLLREIAAWRASSTVSVLINKIYVAYDSTIPEAEVLLQVHDSLAGQFKTPLKDSIIPRMEAAAKITIPFDDPLVIPIGLKTSEVSWGACE